MDFPLFFIHLHIYSVFQSLSLVSSFNPPKFRSSKSPLIPASDLFHMITWARRSYVSHTTQNHFLQLSPVKPSFIFCLEDLMLRFSLSLSSFSGTKSAALIGPTFGHMQLP